MKRVVPRFPATLVQLLPFFFASSHYYSCDITMLPPVASKYGLGLPCGTFPTAPPRMFRSFVFSAVRHTALFGEERQTLLFLKMLPLLLSARFFSSCVDLRSLTESSSDTFSLAEHCTPCLTQKRSAQKDHPICTFRQSMRWSALSDRLCLFWHPAIACK